MVGQLKRHCCTVGLLTLFLPLFVSVAAAQQDRAGTLLPNAAGSGAAAEHCSMIPVRVHSESAAEVEQICAAAKASLDALGACGLRLTVGIAVILTNNAFLRSAAKSWGEFLPADARVNVLSVAMHDTIKRYRFYETDLPTAEHYSGIVAHEVAHAILHQNASGLELPETAHEYIAYVAQLTSYSESTRRRILARDPPIVISSLFVFSHFLRLADPDRFGVNAYMHFARPENGCAFLAAFMQGKVHFPPGTE